MVSDRAALLIGTQFHVEFRYVRSNLSYWRKYLRHERRSRSVLRLAVPYHCSSVFSFCHEERRLCWLTRGSLRSKVDVSQGCVVAFSPVFSYVERQMISDSDSG